MYERLCMLPSSLYESFLWDFMCLLVNIGELSHQAQLAQSLLEMKDAKGRMDSADDALRKAPPLPRLSWCPDIERYFTSAR